MQLKNPASAEEKDAAMQLVALCPSGYVQKPASRNPLLAVRFFIQRDIVILYNVDDAFSKINSIYCVCTRQTGNL